MFFEDHLSDTLDSESSLTELVNGKEVEDLLVNASHQHLSQSEINSELPSGLGATDSLISNRSGVAKGSSSLVACLVQATENERHCPDILIYPETLIDTAVGLIAHQQECIRELSLKERQAAALESRESMSLLPFKASDIMSLELQRLQFFLSELLRCRLRKIELMCMSIYYEKNQENNLTDINSPQRSFLSYNERIVADRLAVAIIEAVLKAGLNGVPQSLQHLVPQLPDGEGIEILPQPDLNTYVFGMALVDLGLVRVGEHAEESIQSGDFFLMPYRVFRPYVRAGQVRLL